MNSLPNTGKELIVKKWEIFIRLSWQHVGGIDMQPYLIAVCTSPIEITLQVVKHAH